jgi:hypothetical protein
MLVAVPPPRASPDAPDGSAAIHVTAESLPFQYPQTSGVVVTALSRQDTRAILRLYTSQRASSENPMSFEENT